MVLGATLCRKLVAVCASCLVILGGLVLADSGPAGTAIAEAVLTHGRQPGREDYHPSPQNVGQPFDCGYNNRGSVSKQQGLRLGRNQQVRLEPKSPRSSTGPSLLSRPGRIDLQLPIPGAPRQRSTVAGPQRARLECCHSTCEFHLPQESRELLVVMGWSTIRSGATPGQTSRLRLGPVQSLQKHPQWFLRPNPIRLHQPIHFAC